MKTNIYIKTGFIATLVIVAVFGILAMPSTTNACGYSGCYQPYPIYENPPIFIQDAFPQYSYNPAPAPIPVPVPVPYPTPVPVPVYYPQPTYNVYAPLSAYCYANTSYAQLGNPVTWTAVVSGGNGGYSYSWSGSENIVGYGQSASVSYRTPGQKLAQVTVYSAGQTRTQQCNTAVTVNGPIYQPQPYPYPVPVPQYPSTGLDVACYADPTSANINQPVNWYAEVTGGYGPYNYSWTGSDGLSGSQNNITKYYSTSGSKYASVTITSADGRSVTKACSNAATVKSSGYTAPKTTKSTKIPYTTVTTKVTCPGACSTNTTVNPVYPPQTVSKTAGTNQNTQGSQAVTNSESNNSNQYPGYVTLNNNQNPSPSPTQTQVASPIFSLSYVPWAWVAILVILVLFGTVLYLMFNKTKM